MWKRISAVVAVNRVSFEIEGIDKIDQIEINQIGEIDEINGIVKIDRI